MCGRPIRVRTKAAGYGYGSSRANLDTKKFLTGNQYVVNGRGQRFISLQGLAVYALTTVHFLIGNLEVELHKSVEEAARLMRLGQGAAMWPAALGFLKPDHGSFGRLRVRISH